MPRIASIVVAVVFSSGAAIAATVAEKKMMEKQMSKVNDSVAYTEKACGTKIAATLDEASFKGEEAMKTANWCSSAVDAIGSLCSDADYKAAISKELKAVKCKYDAAMPAGTSENNYGVKVEKAGTTLNVSYSRGSANVNRMVEEFLKKSL